MNIVDYAYPTMMAEKALKDLHNAALSNDFDLAMESALRAMAEARLAYVCLKEMKRGTEERG